MPFFPHLLSTAIPGALLLIVLASGPLTPAQAQPLGGTGIDAASAVAVVVKVPKPWYAPRWVVVGRMRDTVPQYAALPGLAHKAFSLAQADGQYGGLYLWKDEASARAFFSPDWFVRVEKERGVKGQVQFFEVPVAVANAPGAEADGGDAVGTLVLVATPPGTGKASLKQAFEASVPVYRKIPGLLRKYFIVTDDGRFGGIYLWKDQASAQQWFTEAWKERVLKTYGSAATLEWFDTPILLPSQRADNQPAIPGL
jgi:hypothetical protein